MEARICKIPVGRSDCEEARRKCCECPFKAECDTPWIEKLWVAENKALKQNTLLGPFNPAFFKPDMRAGHVLTFTGKYDFCCFNVPRSKEVVVIGDIYVDESARGMGLSKRILDYLMDTYDRDIFAKCVRGTSAETFWQHVGEQVDANDGRGPDKYEHRLGKRDLGWYIVRNTHKKITKENLW